MIFTYSLDQPGIPYGKGRVFGEFLEEHLGQNAADQGHARQIEPHPAKWEALRVGHRHDVERDIGVMHYPGPHTDGSHPPESQFKVDPQQRKERNEEMSENDDQTPTSARNLSLEPHTSRFPRGGSRSR